MKKDAAFTAEELFADGEPETTKVYRRDDDTGPFVVARELSGAERFNFADMFSSTTWDTYKWLAFTGLVDPKLDELDDVDKLKPEFTVKIAGAVMRLSGIQSEEEDDVTDDEITKKSEVASVDIGTG